MKDTILSVIRLIATPVLLMVLGLILLIHPDSASALVAQIMGWVLVIAGVVFAVSAIAGHFDTVGKVLSAVCWPRDWVVWRVSCWSSGAFRTF